MADRDVRWVCMRVVAAAGMAACACGFAMGQGIGRVADGPVPQAVIPVGETIRPDQLYLRTGRVDLTTPAADLRSTVTDAGAGGRVVVQLDGPMTPARRAALVAAGLHPGTYLPTNAWVARVDRVDAEAVDALGFIRWQGSWDRSWKVDPEIGGARPYATPERQDLASTGRVATVVTLFDGEDAGAARKAIEAIEDAVVHWDSAVGGGVLLGVTMDRGSVPAVADMASVRYIEDAPEVTPRSTTNRWIVQSNQAGVTPLYDAGLRGEGQIVGVLDGTVDVNHCSFADPVNPIGPLHRKIEAYNGSLGASSHGTHVAGIAAGDSGTDNDLRGIAYMGRLTWGPTPSFSEGPVVAALSLHHAQGARIHTNSWGDDRTTAYNSMARGFDVFGRDNEEDLVLLAVTNGSVLRNPENAKNLLAVGASQDTPGQGSHCTAGIGPTTDGRRKPEIYAPGCSTQAADNGTACSQVGQTGTSMACPAVAGVAMLVRQYYMEGFYPDGIANPSAAMTPTGALIKATLLNSAVDMTGISGYPSDLEGWGRVLADNALHFAGEARTLFVVDERHAAGLSTGELDTHAVEVTTSAEQLRFTLVFMDAPAAAGAAFAPVNDLDLEVRSPNGLTYLGNVFAGGVSVPGGTADDRNNVEQVHIASPEVGDWTVRVRGTAVNVGTQGYALVVSGGIEPAPVPVSVVLAAPAPSLIAPGESAPVDVLINPGEDTVIGGSEMLHYSYDGGAFQAIALTPLGDGVYTGSLPAVVCDDEPRFFVSAEGVLSGTTTFPALGEVDPLTAGVGVVDTLADLDMEDGTGWTVGDPSDTATSGVWNRMDPEGTTAQPEDDHTPSGTACWVTDGFAGTSLGTYDVDNGATTLVSPVFDLSGTPEAILGYWRWYSNAAGATPNTDVFTVEVTSDGTSWTTVETVGPSGTGTNGGWFFHEFRVADLVTPTATVRVRFIAEDANAGSIVEAAIDDLRITSLGCEDLSEPCTADLNGDGAVDSADLSVVVGAFGQAVPAGTGGDLNGDGIVDSADLSVLVGEFGAACP